MSMPEAAFRAITALARSEAGLAIAPGKVAMVEARVRRRLRALGIADYREYCALIEGSSEASAAERRALVNAMTTNVTALFRERHHFPVIAEHVARALSDRSRRNVSIWSAGGSDGSEGVSALLSVAAAVPCLDLARLRVVVTDIDDDAIAAAEHGLYPLASLTAEERLRFAPLIATRDDGLFALVPALRARIEVRRHNLVRSPAAGLGFDVVLCRNVLIYFDDATKRLVQDSLVAAVRPGGMLFLGHSERLLPEATGADQMTRVGITCFRRELAGRRLACQ